MASDEKPNDTPLPTGVALTALDPTFREDPYPILDELRRREPVHHDETFKRWILTRHEDVAAVLRDRAHGVDPHKGAPDTYASVHLAPNVPPSPSIIFLDPPAHTRLRGLVSKAFTPRAVEAMAPRIQAITDRLLDAVAGREDFDVISDFASPLPIEVICDMLGIDAERQSDFKVWSEALVLAFDPMLTDEGRQQMTAGLGAMHTYFEEIVQARRGSPKDDLISALIAAEESGEKLTNLEIVTMCSLLLAAGNLTTTDLIGNGVLVLLKHPGELAKLRADPSLIKNAVEELLRFESSIAQATRILAHDVELPEATISAGQTVIPMTAAAHRDPAAYPDPHRFDVTRKDTHHYAFGGGIHTCLGAPLARIETQIALGALIKRFPKLRLAGDPLVWRHLPGFRAVTSLRVLIS
jgi:hypothetical protein